LSEWLAVRLRVRRWGRLGVRFGVGDLSSRSDRFVHVTAADSRVLPMVRIVVEVAWLFDSSGDEAVEPGRAREVLEWGLTVFAGMEQLRVRQQLAVAAIDPLMLPLGRIVVELAVVLGSSRELRRAVRMREWIAYILDGMEPGLRVRLADMVAQLACEADGGPRREFLESFPEAFGLLKKDQ
jgi:hypothetical protein